MTETTQKPSDDMMTFRTAYLRLVAAAWKNETFRGQVLKPSVIRDSTSGVAFDVHVDTLSQSFQKFGFSLSRWEGLQFELSSEGPKFDANRAIGWFGAGFSKITLRLPLTKPEEAKDGADQAQALADYYQLRPTMFGQLVDGLPGGTASGRGPDYGLGNWEDFLEFGGVTLRAIALAWQEGPQGPFVKALKKNALSAFQGWLSYDPQWNLDIFVADAPRSKWVNSPTPGESYWELEEKNLVTLDFPSPPLNDDNQTISPIAPLALAAYNNTGELYPFTCCV